MEQPGTTPGAHPPGLGTAPRDRGGSGEAGPGTGSPSQPPRTLQSPRGLREAGVSPPSRGTPGAPPAPRVAPRGGGRGGGAARSLPPGSPRGTPSPARLPQQPSSPQPPAPGLQARVGQGGAALPRRSSGPGPGGRRPQVAMGGTRCACLAAACLPCPTSSRHICAFPSTTSSSAFSAVALVKSPLLHSSVSGGNASR